MHVGPHVDPLDATSPSATLKHNIWQCRVPEWMELGGHVACGGGCLGGGGYGDLAVGQGGRESGHLLTNWIVDEETLDDAGRQGAQLGPGFSVIDSDVVVANAAPGYEIPLTQVLGYYDENLVGTDFPWEFDDKDEWVAATVISRFPNALDLTGTPTADVWDGTPLVVLVRDAEGGNCYAHAPESICTACCGGTPSTGYVITLPTESGVCQRPELWFFRARDLKRAADGEISIHAPRAYASLDLSPWFWTMREEQEYGCAEGMRPLAVTFDPVRCILYVTEQGRSGNDQHPPFVLAFAVGW